ncbi:MAG: PQQ-binding-like beta-propeller repeat protein [Opitutae bacterium]|nr:PQQ-binding-like beta-propeller repeat protein [Opitutae bacterium]
MKAQRLTLLLLGGIILFFDLLSADVENVFNEAENSYLSGEFHLGNKLLDELITANPGDMDIAVRALHRMCLGEFIKLTVEDWPSADIPKQLWDLSRRNAKKNHELTSTLLREAYLEVGIFPTDPGQATSSRQSMNPQPRINRFTRDKILESLQRRKSHYPLTPMENISDLSMNRIHALKRTGFISGKHPAFIDASVLLVFLRYREQRYIEAAELADQLVAANNQHVDWLFSRARLHSSMGSPRTRVLFRELFEVLDQGGVDPVMADVLKRSEPFLRLYGNTSTRDIEGPLAPGWFGQMLPNDENPIWRKVLKGLVEGLENRIDLWIQGSLGSNMDRASMSRLDGLGSAMSWDVLDNHLQSLDQKALLPLRDFQESGCLSDPRSNMIARLTQRGRLELFRRFPWAETAHEALGLYANMELEYGNGQAARRAYRDILNHSINPAHIRLAKVGLWTAVSLADNPSELEVLIKGVNEDEMFPWMDGTASLGEIRERLMSGMSEPDSASGSLNLQQLKPSIVKLPPTSIWPTIHGRHTVGLEHVNFQFTDDGILLSTRDFMAWYDLESPEQPVWNDLGRSVTRDRSLGRLGNCRPVIKDGFIYTRWGYKADPYYLIAMDADTRRILWSLDVTGPSDARSKIPLGNPILLEGKLYTASAWARKDGLGTYRLRITCVEAVSGEVVWQSDTEMQTGDKGMYGVIGDVLTVKDGEIYCTPGAEELFRLDARDGSIEWTHLYPRKQGRRQQHYGTLGSAPVIAGDVVICLPRDTDLLIGLDRRTGNPLWRSSLLLPSRILGVNGEQVIIQGRSVLASVNARSGKLKWMVPLTDHILSLSVLLNDSIYVTTGTELHRYDSVTGVLLESHKLPETGYFIWNMAIRNDQIFLITNEPASRNRDLLARKGNAGALWQVEARDIRVFVPRLEDSAQSRLLLHEGERLQCIDTNKNGELLWERFVHPQPKEVYFIGKKGIFVYHSRYDIILVALDLDTGRMSWKLELPRGSRWYGRLGESFFIKDNSDRFTLVDLSKGKIVAKKLVPRRNGSVFTHFGDSNIHLVRAVNHYYEEPALYWLSWNPSSGELVGHDNKLKGLLSDPNQAFGNSHLHTARFGREALYFVSSKRDGEEKRPTIYRGEYHDRSIHVVRYDARLHDLKSKYLLFQDEGRQREIKNIHAWVIHREDDPKYEYQIDLPRHSTVSLMNDGLLLEVMNQKPKTLRLYDLDSKKVSFTHVTEDPERLGAVRVGPNHIAVFEFRRNQYFRVTPYHVESGKAGTPLEIDYWIGNHDHPREFHVVGNLLLVSNPSFLQAWNLDGLLPSNIPR